MLSIIAGYDQNRGLGYEGKLPWHAPMDLKNFKKITLNSSVVMGRKTFESIGKPLVHRNNYILSRNLNLNLKHEDVIILNSPQLVFQKAFRENVFIIGGQALFELFIAHAKHLYLSEFKQSYPADCWFPKFDQSAFRVLETIEFEEDPQFVFKHLERKA